MTTHTAVIGTSPGVTAGDCCDVTVIVNDDTRPGRRLGTQVALPATPIAIRTDDPGRLAEAEGVAEAFLAACGWHVTGPWETAGSALHAPVRRGPRVNDPEMREALVHQLAQYILRGEAHTKRPPHSEAQILARARLDVDDMAYDYTFPEGEAERIAADAQELATRVQETNPNWDQWAFGH
jgi:hypothetical protein